ncbi:MAG: hypothetical protein PHF35_04980 [Candidatus Moranbacteria bacterium]|nr:hypothetical protein [Candidatus Moranbacteria bacterium]
MVKRTWRSSDLRSGNPSKNKKFQKLLSDPAISRALNEKREQRELYGILKSAVQESEKNRRNFSDNDLRILFGGLRSGKIKTKFLSRKEIIETAREIFPDSSRRYSFKTPKEEKKKNLARQNKNTRFQGDNSRGSRSQKRAGGKNAKYNPEASADLGFAKPGFSEGEESFKEAKPNFLGKTDPPKPPKIEKKQPLKRVDAEHILDYDVAKVGFFNEKGEEIKNPGEKKSEPPKAENPQIPKKPPLPKKLGDEFNYAYQMPQNQEETEAIQANTEGNTRNYLDDDSEVRVSHLDDRYNFKLREGDDTGDPKAVAKQSAAVRAANLMVQSHKKLMDMEEKNENKNTSLKRNFSRAMDATRQHRSN